MKAIFLSPRNLLVIFVTRIGTQQRQNSILDLLSQQGEVNVESLSNQFKTSEVTIRKDLRQLASEHKLVRKFGGAVRINFETKQNDTPKVSFRKVAIAKTAAGLIKKGDRIVLDSGSTVLEILPFLTNRSDLVVMTNSLKVANQLTSSDSPPKVLFTGGTWDPQSDSFQGKMAEQMLAAYDFDLAFIGAAGLDPLHGTTTFNELINLSKAMATNSSRVVIMAEANKLNRKIPNIELPWNSISTLISDDSIDSKSVKLITDQGVDVIRALAEDS